MSCGLATRLARNLNRRTYHQNFTFRAMGAAVGAAHGGNRMVCVSRVHRWHVRVHSRLGEHAWSDHQCFRRPHRRPRLCAWQSGNVALIWARTGGMMSLIGPKRRLAASQPYVRSRGRSRHGEIAQPTRLTQTGPSSPVASLARECFPPGAMGRSMLGHVPTGDGKR
jgi:hypothetical protein